ncbi:hypothetical protein AB5I41_31610 [Sphingomonas sp. MMS24-JH45]
MDALIEDNVQIITQLVDEDDEMDLDAFLDLCRTAVLRDGVRLSSSTLGTRSNKRRRDENETDHISRALRAIKKFAKQYQVAFWIVAAISDEPHDGAVKVPGLLNISGSANWANKADYGLTYRSRPP